MFLSKTESKDIVAGICDLKIKEDDVVVIMLAEDHSADILSIVTELNKRKINFFGGIFPGLIHGTEKHDKGALITVFPSYGDPVLLSDLNNEEKIVADIESKMPQNLNKKATAVVFVDGLCAGIGMFLSGLYNQLGNTVHYFGGGAGFLTLEQKPCLFSAEGFFQDAAIISFIQLESHLGVRHGWEKIAGPVVATNTDSNTIKELNWNSAFSVYKDVVESDSGESLTADNFFDIAKGYPFGIIKEGMEDVVRDPISTNEKGELICVGEVPENTVLSILKGKKETLIRAVGRAVDDCLTINDEPISHCMVVDCISRVIFLEEEYTKELEQVSIKMDVIDQKIIPFGVLTLGEISSYGEGYLEFFNKTIVICVGYSKP